MLNNEVYNFASEKIKQMENTNEATTRQRIVIPVLNSLGYENDCFTFEYREEHKNKIVDILWKKNDDDCICQVKIDPFFNLILTP